MIDNTTENNFISQIVLPPIEQNGNERLYLIKDKKAHDDISILQSDLNSLDASVNTLDTKVNNIRIPNTSNLASKSDLNNALSNFITRAEVNNSYVKWSTLLSNYSNNTVLNNNYAHMTNGVIDNASINYEDVEGLNNNYAHITANGVIDNAIVNYTSIKGLNDNYAHLDSNGNIDNAYINYVYINGLNDNYAHLDSSGSIDNASINYVYINGLNDNYAHLDENNVIDNANIDYSSVNGLYNNFAHISGQTIDNAYIDYSYINGLTENFVHMDENGIIDNAQINYADIQDLNAHYAEIENGKIKNATINYAQVDDLYTNYAKIERGTIVNATIDQADVNNLDANYAHITQGVIDNAYIDYGRINYLSSHYAHISEGVIDNALIDQANVNDLDAHYAHIEDGVIDNATISYADVDDLEANYAHITNGVIDRATIGYAQVNDLDANYAHITDGVIDRATISYANVDDLNAHYAEIDIANVNNAWIENGVIKDAAISDAKIIGVSANKLTAGTIDASNINVTNLRADNLIATRINGQPVIGGYTLVNSSSVGYINKNPSEEGWYELSNNGYILSTDTTINNNKKYYRNSESIELYDQNTIDGMVDNLNARIDSQIETWTTDAVPTLNNYPAEDWLTNDEKAEHIGDICYVLNAGNNYDGFTYRFAYDNTSHQYMWVLIKDNQVTAALGRLTNAENKITGLETFETNTSTWITQTDQGLETIRSNYTTLSGRVDKTVKSTVQLWFTKANTTAPSAPTSVITNNNPTGANSYNKWNLAVPEYNANYPYYYYCWQYTFEDDTTGWSAVIYDRATTEAEERARTGIVNAAAAQTTANNAIKSSIQLWFAKANDTPPSKPESEVTSSETIGNAWRKVCPAYNSSYPYYFYCYQQQKGDGTFQWTDVIYDRAITETQSTSRTTASNLSNYITNNDQALEDLQNQLDGQLEIWYGSANPINTTSPASTWDATDKDNHIGDLYYNTTDGTAWQWIKNGSTYSWTQIPDSAAAAALGAAQDAKDTADGKRRVFTTTPTVPYDKGDLWVNGDEIKYATTAKTSSQSYSASDWAQTATDDTAANAAQTTANQNIKSTVQLWFSKANNTAPNPPTSHVTSTATTGNGWTIAVPAYNSAYPYYYYCYEYQKGDGTYFWSSVIYDRATTETQSTARATSSSLSNYITNNDAALAALQSQVDNQLEIWYGDSDPTTLTQPASSWDNDEKANHVGDLYYNTTDGSAWQWTVDNSVYSWTQIPDSAASVALAAAQDAQATADGKRRIFTSTPTVPYDIGDLWVTGNQVKYATAKKTSSQSYAAADWAQTATDDTMASANIKSSVQLWYTSNSTTSPNKPYTDGSSSYVSSTSTNGNTWTTVVPLYNSSTPKYHYCYQQQRGDGKYQWTTPVYDDATSTAMAKAQSALPSSTFIDFQNTTFKDVVDEVDQQSVSINSLTTITENNGLTSSTNITNAVSTVSQTVDEISQSIESLEQTVEEKADNSTVQSLQSNYNTLSDTVDGHTQNIASINNTLTTKADGSTVTSLTTKVNSISDTVDGHTSSLSNITSTQTSMQNTLNKTVKASIQLWYSKQNTTAPNPPTSQVTNNSTNGGAWTTVVPAYNATYPNYYYCWQYQYTDNTYGWSAVVYDQATTETQSTARTATSNLANYITTNNAALQTLQNQVDGQIEAWYYSVDPTTSNAPAEDWTTDTLKSRHEGDLYYNVSSGHSWRWLNTNGTYSWQQIPDSDASAALAAAQNAQTTANNKRRIFTTTPTVPYDIGDLWVNGSEIKYATVSKASTGTYSASDWTQTATDDTAANAAQDTANANIKSSVMLWYSKENNTAPNKPSSHITSTSTNGGAWRTVVPTYNSSYPYYFYCYEYQKGNGTYTWSDVVYDRATTETQSTARATASSLSSYITSNNSALAALQSQVDGQLEIWYGTSDPTTSNAPASGWDATAKADHVGDIYYNTTSGAAFQWTVSSNTYSWTAIPDSAASAALQAANDAQATADGKRRVFTSTPTVPYDIGDLWVNGDEVKYATTARLSGSYTATDWAQTATDDTAANAAQNTANTNIKSSTQLWFTKADATTAPNKPTTQVTTSNANTTNAWNLVVPIWNSSYPHYYYCYQQQKGDGTWQWTDVVYDRATSEAQQLANTVNTNVNSLQLDYANFKQTTQNFESTIGTTYATKTELGNLSDEVSAQQPFVIDTQTAATRWWRASCSELSELKDGQQLTLWLSHGHASSTAQSQSIAASDLVPTETVTTSYSNAWFNLTLSDNQQTGWIPVYYGGTTRTTSHYGVNSAIHLTYRENVSSSIPRGWWCDANYDSNTTYTKLLSTVKAGLNGLKSYTLCMKDANGNWTSIVNQYTTANTHTAYAGGLNKENVAYYSSGTNNVSAGGTGGDGLWESYTIDFRYSANLATTSTLTTRDSVYLVGTIGTDGLFYLNQTNWYTQTPNVQNAIYILLGYAYSGYQIFLNVNNPCYIYDGSKLVEYTFDRLTRAETSITQTNEAIALKANASDVYTKTQTDGLISTEVSNRNSAIEQSASAINLSVSQTYTTKTEFNNRDFDFDNLLPNAREMALSASGVSDASIGRWRLAGNADMAKSRIEIEDGPFGSCGAFQLIGTQNADNDTSCFGIDSFPFIKNERYRMSMYARVINGSGYAGINQVLTGSAYGRSYVNSNKTYSWATYQCIELDSSWKQIWVEFKADATSGNLYIGGAGTDAIIQICMVSLQIAKTSHAEFESSKAEIKTTTDGITSTVEKISSAKYLETSYQYTLSGCLGYAAEGYSGSWTVTDTKDTKIGDTVYLKVKDTTRNCFIYIKGTVTNVNGNSVRCTSHGYEDVLPINTIKSTINQSSDSVKIQARHVEIDGAAIFSNSAFKAAADAAYDPIGSAAAAQSAAASDATTKANDAKSAAISAAATDATNKANDAKSAAISAAATDATQKADAAQAAAEATAAADATAKVNAIQIGGRNLLPWSTPSVENYTKIATPSSSNSFVTEDGYACYKITGSATNGTHYASNGKSLVSLEADTQYTYSAWVKLTTTNSTTNVPFNFTSLGHFSIINSASTASDKTHEDIPAKRVYSPATISVDVWTKIQLTFTTNSLDGSKFGVYPKYNLGDAYTLFIRDQKLEKGNKATDWTPAPEDIDADIAAVQTIANGANAQEQIIYKSAASGTANMTGTTTWITDLTGSQATWTTKRPIYSSSYPVLFVATQRKTVDGTVTCTTPQKDDTTTIIDGGHITTGTIDASVVTVTNLDANEITSGSLTSTNYMAAATTGVPYSALGSKIELSTGNIYTPSFGVINNSTNQNYPVGLYINDGFIAKSGKIGWSSENYWDVGTLPINNSTYTTGIVATGNSLINVGELILESNNDLNNNASLHTGTISKSSTTYTRNYLRDSDNYYRDYGLQAPVLNSSATNYTAGVDDNFIYIKKSPTNSAVPSSESDWNYLFRIDKEGNLYTTGSMYINGQLVQSGGNFVKVSGDSNITGNLGISGNLTITNGSLTGSLNKSITFAASGGAAAGSSFNNSNNLTVSYATIGAAASSHTHSYLPLAGGTLSGGLNFSNASAAIGWTDGAVRQRIKITDDSTANTNVFEFQQSTNSGSSYTSLFTIKDNGTVVATTFSGALSGNATTATSATSATKDSEGNQISTTYLKLSGGTLTGDLTSSADIIVNGDLYSNNQFYADNGTIGNLIINGNAVFNNGLTGNLTGTADKATKDSAGNQINTTYIKGLSISGKTITYTKGDNTTGTITTQDTTYTNGTGLSLNGTQFYVTSANVSTMINLLTEGSSNANRNDYAVVQYASGGTTTTTYHRRKLSNVFAALNKGDITTALGFTPYDETNPDGYTTNTGTVTSITLKAGSGITLDTDNTAIITSGTRTISHADTSSQASITAADRTYIKSVTLDTYGHVTGLTTGTETVTNTHNTAYLYAGASNGSTNAETTNGNTYLILKDGDAVSTRRKISGSGTVSVASDASGNITISGTAHPTTLKNPNAIKINVYNGSSTATTTTYDGGTANQSVNVASNNAITGISASTSGGSTTFTLTTAAGGTSTFDVNVTGAVVTGATTLTNSDGTAVGAGGATTAPVYFSGGLPIAVTSIPSSLISGTINPSSHTHGNITNSGDITTTATIADGDRLIINDESASKITNSSITFGTSETLFLSNKGTWVTPSGTYSLPLAANGTRGGVQIGYTQSGKNYPVQLSSEKMYVNVPWENTTYSAGTGLSLSGTTFSNSGVRSITTGTANGTISVNTNGTSSDVNVKGLEEGYLRIHPEVTTKILIPYLNNDLAFITSRNGIVKVYYDGVDQGFTDSNSNIGNMFNGSYDTFNPPASTVSEVIVEIKSVSTYAWTSLIYADFGPYGAKNVKIEVKNSNFENDVWTTKYNVTNRAYQYAFVSTTHTPVGGTNNGNGFDSIRFTFSNWMNSTMFRIAQLGVVNYSSLGPRWPLMSRGKDDAVYRNITPAVTNTYSLGGSNNKWSNIYATSLYGTLTGNVVGGIHQSTMRPTTANRSATATGNLTHYLATTSMTTAKPMHDGHIIDMDWDNAGGYASQLFIPNNSKTADNPHIQWRAQNGGTTWGEWLTVYDSASVIPVINGGTGNTSFTTNKLLYASSDTQISSASNITIDNTNGKITITSPSGQSNNVTVTRANGPTVWLGVGTADVNHGVYSDTLNKWLVYADSNNVYLNGTASAAPWSGITDKPATATRWPAWNEISQSGANSIEEGTSDLTDNSEILTSYASNNGFADTNATGKVYRRDAIHVYNYIKGKTDNIYVKKSGDTMTGYLTTTNLGIANTSGTAGNGISLYNGGDTVAKVWNYGIAFAGTNTYGKYGTVQGDWATYFTMTGANNRGWIFKHGGGQTTSGNVASINGQGKFQGLSYNVAGHCNLEYNTTTESLDFVFS